MKISVLVNTSIIGGLILGEDYPVSVSDDGIVIKTKLMTNDQIYHCIYQSKLYLFFKDENDMLNCYEVEDEEAAEAIKANPDSNSIKKILQEYAKKHQ
jgi:hypothetical protein